MHICVGSIGAVIKDMDVKGFSHVKHDTPPSYQSSEKDLFLERKTLTNCCMALQYRKKGLTKGQLKPNILSLISRSNIVENSVKRL